jgi:hypothetical protein
VKGGVSLFYLEEALMDKEKHMGHLRNILGAVEDKGYTVLSIGYDGDRVTVVVDNPYYAGNRAFLEKAAGQEGRAGITGV